MKLISREITLYSYTFANIDVSSGMAINMFTIEQASPLTNAEHRKISGVNNGAVVINKSSEKKRFAMPVDDFISACREYAKTLNNKESTNNGNDNDSR